MAQTPVVIDLSAGERVALAHLLEYHRAVLGAAVTSSDDHDDTTELGLLLAQVATECEAIEDAALPLTLGRMQTCLALISDVVDVAAQCKIPPDIATALEHFAARMQQAEQQARAEPRPSSSSATALAAQDLIDTDA